MSDVFKCEKCGAYYCDECSCSCGLHKPIKAGQWVNVAERLPEENKVVLTWKAASDCTGFEVASRNKYGWFRESNNSETFCTHWMPLPEPPK